MRKWTEFQLLRPIFAWAVIFFMMHWLIVKNHHPFGIVDNEQNLVLSSKHEGSRASSSQMEMHVVVPSLATNNIFLNWYHDSDRFNYLNYKCIESILIVYPNSSVVIFIIAPPMANYYKIGKILSRQTFQKYTKSGFPIRFEVISKDVSSGPMASNPGFQYWVDALKQHDQDKHISALGKAQHVNYFITFYYILVRLYREGGMYNDFSWFHLRRFEPSELKSSTGYFVQHVCNQETNLCAISSFLLFPSQHPVLFCMMKQYENSTFIACGEDSESKVEVCLMEAFQFCFLETLSLNAFEDWKGSSVTQADWFKKTSIEAQDEMNLPIWWLGHQAYDGNWDRPDSSSVLSKQINLNDAFLQSSPKLNKEILYDFESASFPPCHRYQTWREDSLSFRNQASLSCTLQFVIPGFMKAGSSYVFDTVVNNHPLLLRTLKGVQFKESGCYSPEKITPNTRTRRAYCFPFVEEGENKYFGDATVSYAGRHEVPEFMKLDNSNLKVVFVVRSPIARSVSHHRFDYAAYHSKGIGSINHCVDQLFVFDQRLQMWSELAKASSKTQSDLGCRALQQLMSLYRKGLRHNSTSIYAKCGNLILNSLYVLHMIRWYQVFGYENIRVINVEWLHPRHLEDSQKTKWLDRSLIDDPTGTLVFNSSSKQQKADRRITNKDILRNKATRLTNLDHKYLLVQFNSIYRFIGIPPLAKKRISIGGGHESEATVPKYDQLNNTSEGILADFFAPFENLLTMLVTQQLNLSCIKN